MKHRCSNPNADAYQRYGGRGITCCAKWQSFLGFFEDMGHPPDGFTLERVDNNKGYCKENCVWATKTEQANNTRSNLFIEINGVRKTVAQWAVEPGARPAYTIYMRLRRGREPFDAVFSPPNKLNREMANEIRASSESTKALRERYGVSDSLIRAVRKGVRWASA